MAINLAIQSDPVPSGFCPISNLDWQSLVRLLHVSLTSDPTINYGNVTPVPEKRGLPWFRLNSDGSPDYWYAFNNGLWINRHPTPTGTIILYRGDPGAIATFDGGNANPVSATDGPFWQRVTECDGKFPFGAGTFASGTVVAVKDTGGSETIALTLPQTPVHNHLIANSDEKLSGGSALSASNSLVSKLSNLDSGYALQGDQTAAAAGLTSNTGGATDGSTTGHNNIPPYYAVLLLERTGRLYRTQNA